MTEVYETAETSPNDWGLSLLLDSLADVIGATRRQAVEIFNNLCLPETEAEPPVADLTIEDFRQLGLAA